MLIAGILLFINFSSYDNEESSYKKIPLIYSISIGGILGFIFHNQLVLLLKILSVELTEYIQNIIIVISASLSTILASYALSPSRTNKPIKVYKTIQVSPIHKH